MGKACDTCKYQKLTARDEPCYDCVNLKNYEPIEKDSKQCWIELVAMYVAALGNDKDISEWVYETKKDKFMDTLSQLKNAIIREYEEEM